MPPIFLFAVAAPVFTASLKKNPEKVGEKSGNPAKKY
jgi:hypothetical protein